MLAVSLQVFVHHLDKEIVTNKRTESYSPTKPIAGELFFDQLVDHFDNTNQKTFKQRYLINKTFYNDSEASPLFVMIGGEGEISAGTVSDGFSAGWFIAQMKKGLLVSFEHRFYGVSFPENDSSNLTLLSSRQTIADYSTFLAFMKEQYNISKIIVVGGSYPGSIAVWLRQQLPFIVDGALSSSGPILAQVEIPEYLNHVMAQFGKATDIGENCREFVEDVFEYAQKLIFSTELADQHQLIEAFNMSLYMDFSNFTDYDKWCLFEVLINDISSTIQGAKGKDYNGKPQPSTIDQQCQIFKVAFGDSLSSKLKIYAQAHLINNMNVTFQALIDSLRNTNINSPSQASRGWYYQTCVEFGFFSTSEVPNHKFSFPLDYSVEMCYRAYFIDYNITKGQTLDYVRQMVAETNEWYGARNIPRDHIIYCNGEYDPWSRLSVSPDMELSWTEGLFLCKGCENLIVKGASHCADLYSTWTINEEVRNRELDIIKGWLNEE